MRHATWDMGKRTSGIWDMGFGIWGKKQPGARDEERGGTSESSHSLLSSPDALCLMPHAPLTHASCLMSHAPLSLPHSALRTPRSASRAITYIELVIVIGILGILLMVAIPVVSGYVDDSKRGKAAADLKTIQQAVHKFQRAKETEINSLVELEGTYIVNVRQLKDPWGQDYGVDTKELRLYSKGSNGRYEHGKGDDVHLAYRVPATIIRLKNFSGKDVTTPDHF